MTGDARIPEDPPAGAVGDDPRGRYPPRSPDDRERLLRFAREAPLVGRHWQALKGLYKLAESAEDPELLGALVARLDGAPVEGAAEDGSPPAAVTLGYMKRRARRGLRRLGERDPGRYAEVAFHTLRLAGAGRADLDLRCQWVSADILYGEQPGVRQLRHGRGRYVLPPGAGAAPRNGGAAPRRHERFPQAWDARPDLARRLFEADALAAPVRVAALRMLRAAGLPAPRLGPASLRAFLFAPAAEAARVAADQVADDAQAGALPEPELLARTLLVADGATCGRLLAALVHRFASGRLSGEDEQHERVAAALVTDLAARVRRERDEAPRAGAGAGRPSRWAYDPSPTVQLGATLLTGPLRPCLPADLAESLVPVAGALLSAEAQPVAGLGLLAIEAAPVSLAPVALRAAVRGSPSWRVAALERLLLTLRGRSLSDETVYLLVSGGTGDAPGAGAPEAAATETYRAGWDVLARLPVDAATARRLWGRLLVRGDTGTLAAATSSEPALELLHRAGLDPDTAGAVRAETLGRLPPALSELVLAAMAPPHQLAVTARASAPAWGRVGPGLAGALGAPGAALAFWTAVWRPVTWRGLRTAEGRQALVRLGADPLGATLLLAGPAALPPWPPPVAGGAWVLRRWADLYVDRLERGSPVLLALADYPAGRVGDRARWRLHTLGYSPSAAVTLLGRGGPAVRRAVRWWVLTLPAGHPDAVALALALTAHPDPGIAGIGRRFVRGRLDSLPLADLARQNPGVLTPEARVRLAEELLHADPVPEWAAGFDAALLQDGKGPPRARSLVRARLERDPAAGTPALLSAARGAGVADAERALQQLTLLALAGQPVDGLTVDTAPAGEA